MNLRSSRQQRRCTWSTRLLVLAMATAILLTMIPRGGIAAAEGNQDGLNNANVADVILTEEEQEPDQGDAPDDIVVAPVDPTETPEGPDDVTDVPAEPTGTPQPPDDVTTADEEPEPTGTIEIKKWACPEGFAGSSWEEYLAACTVTMNDVPFYASSNGAELPGQFTGAHGDGTLVWDALDAGPVVVQEGIPAGYGEPVVYCGFTGIFSSDAGVPAIVDGFIGPDAVAGGVLMHELLPEGYLYCDWFNIPTGGESGSITIIKHTCYPGYDVNAPGANPRLDCPVLTNGVPFTLYHGADVPLQTMTGDSIDGGVFWGGLMAGDYQVQETAPADMAYGFVFGCYNTIDDAPAPTNLIGLEFDNTLLVELHEGEDLVCHWYNVPNQHGGTVIITKYWCDGDITSIYACDRYEGGATFQIGGTQVTTGADGSVSIALDAGAYDLDEVGGTWCAADASNVDGQGRIVVEDGETTSVTVFNCGPRETPQGKPTPGKFPNTGLGPLASEQQAA